VNYRRHAEIRGFFDGFDLVEPGLVFIPQWRPDRPAPFVDRTLLELRGGRPQAVSGSGSARSITN